jgi:hypothetical protein
MSFSDLSEGLMESLNSVDEGIETDSGESEVTETPATDDAASDDVNIDDAASDDESKDADGNPVDEGTPVVNEDDSKTVETNQISKEDLEALKESIFAKIKEGSEPQETKPETNPTDGEEGEVESNPIDDLMKQAEDLRNLPEDEFRDKIFENAKETMDTLVKAGVQEQLKELLPKLEPMIKEREEKQQTEQEKVTATEYVDEFANKTEDFKEYAQDMAKILDSEKMGMDPKNLEIAYWKAKSQRSNEPDVNKKTLDEFLGDEESLKQLVGNDNLQDQIVSQYLKGIADGKPPKSISNSDGSSPVGKGEKKRGGFKGAGEELLRALDS